MFIAVVVGGGSVLLVYHPDNFGLVQYNFGDNMRNSFSEVCGVDVEIVTVDEAGNKYEECQVIYRPIKSKNILI